MQQSEIIITKDIEKHIQKVSSQLPLHSFRIIKNEEDEKNNFKIIHATKAIKEAYIASSQAKYIIICGDKFELEAQNKLLKVLEEPPRNIIFILITTSKSSLLPTILSRMPHRHIKTQKQNFTTNINIIKADLKDIYIFLKQNQRISKEEAKQTVQTLIYQLQKNKLQLNAKELDIFSRSIKLLELNSKPINVLTTLILTIFHSPKKNNNRIINNAIL